MDLWLTILKKSKNQVWPQNQITKKNQINNKLIGPGNVQKPNGGGYNKKSINHPRLVIFIAMLTNNLVLRRHPFSKIKNVLGQKSIFLIF
jgi:calcineurin-like phosphoesterase